MTTVSALIEFLQKCPSDAFVFTNQYGGDWSVEKPVDLVVSKIYHDAWVNEDADEYLSDTKYFENCVSSGDIEKRGWSQKKVVRLVA